MGKECDIDASVFNYVQNANMPIDLFAAVVAVLWPELEERDGVILLAGNSDEQDIANWTGLKSR